MMRELQAVFYPGELAFGQAGVRAILDDFWEEHCSETDHIGMELREDGCIEFYVWWN